MQETTCRIKVQDKYSEVKEPSENHTKVQESLEKPLRPGSKIQTVQEASDKLIKFMNTPSVQEHSKKHPRFKYTPRNF